jgi:hypothetical protein
MRVYAMLAFAIFLVAEISTKKTKKRGESVAKV